MKRCCARLYAIGFGVLERRPVRRFFAKPADVFFHDLFERNTFELFRTLMTGDGHGLLLIVRVGGNLFEAPRDVMPRQRVRPEVAGPMTGSGGAPSSRCRYGQNCVYWIIRLRG